MDHAHAASVRQEPPLRGDLEDDAGAVGAAGAGGAVEVALGVEGWASYGEGAIGAGEAVENGVDPFAGAGLGRGHLEDYAAASASAGACAASGGTVQVAGRVDGQAALRSSPVFELGEVVEDGFFPATVGAACELKDGAAASALAALASANQCRAVQVASPIQGQAGGCGVS